MHLQKIACYKKISSVLNRSIFLLGLLVCGIYMHAQTNATFPLKFSNNKRYLVDKNNKPFLVKEFSAWAIIQALSENEEAAFLDSLKEKGFNTVITGIICNAPSQMTGNPPFWQGISPFNVQWDFSTPNLKYFEHADRFFKMAEEKNFFVMVLPCYMGYTGDASQGWWNELLNSKNDTLKMHKYGEFLGKRYQNTKNIMWIAGGDNNCDGDLFAYENNLIAGIKTFDKNHYWSAHFDMNKGSVWSSDNKAFSNKIDIDGEYVWTESVLFERGPQYKCELTQYHKKKMIIQLDQSYEHDVPHFADNENYEWIRRKMYDGLLSGCAGTSFSSGDINNQCYSFKNWQPLMNTEGMMYVNNCFKLFEKLPWYKLIPDETNNTITKGRENFGSKNYICAAKANDSSVYVMYIAKGGEYELNMKAMCNKPMRMNWYNPRTGANIKIGTAEVRERYAMVPPSEEDWVLVFYDVSLNLFGTH
jgi:hypothetical protein